MSQRDNISAQNGFVKNLNVGNISIAGTSTIPYTPADGAHWADPDPTTLVEAIDRLAAQVYTVHTSTPIP